MSMATPWLSTCLCLGQEADELRQLEEWQAQHVEQRQRRKLWAATDHNHCEALPIVPEHFHPLISNK